MNEYEKNFNKIKLHMDNKTFKYDNIQPWEKNIENKINESSIVKGINNLLNLFKLD